MAKILSTFLMVAFLFSASSALGGEKTLHFAWNQELPYPNDLAGWRLYYSEKPGGPYVYFAAIPYTAPSEEYKADVLFTGPNVKKKWHWVLTAFDTYEFESEYSNEASATIDLRIYDQWKGTTSFPIRITSTVESSSGDITFQNLQDQFTGAMEIYIDEDGFLIDVNDCYLKLSGDDGTDLCIKQLASVSTDVKKSRSDQILLIGTGDITLSTGDPEVKGIVYLDAKGTLKKDSFGEATSISLSGKVGIGFDLDFIYSGSFRMTLTR